ncbi:hypothetical protein AB0F45_37075 [Streptomyces achromogenes]|uniref:hypothetical protein n=1 Tax=Streptomyces achromogenes TaxID=67255 RepID=UPI0033CA461C
MRGVGERRIGRNDVLLGAIRTAGGAPGPISRAAAEMNAALYDAESSYRLRWHTMTSDPYLKAVDYAAWAEGPGEEERIIGRTAYNILLKLFPARRPTWTTSSRSASAPAPRTSTSRPTSYPDLPDPGCGQGSRAAIAAWGKVKPWALTSGSQFRPSTPGQYASYENLLASPAYAEQVRQVRDLGAAGSTTCRGTGV